VLEKKSWYQADFEGNPPENTRTQREGSNNKNTALKIRTVSLRD
jgi:hypothetical protein